MNHRCCCLFLAVAMTYPWAGAVRAETSGPVVSEGMHAQELDAAGINAKLKGAVQAQRTEPKPPTAKRKARLIVMKRLLKDIPPAERAEVLNSLMLVNGAVASFTVGPLREHFSGDMFYDTVRTIEGPPKGEAIVHRGEPARHADLSVVLKDVPLEVRNEFLDNMVFENGQLVSVYIGGLRKTVDGGALNKILDLLAGDSRTRPEVKVPKVLCGNGWCTHAVCAAVTDTVSGLTGEYPAVMAASGDNVCYTSCGEN